MNKEQDYHKKLKLLLKRIILRKGKSFYEKRKDQTTSKFEGYHEIVSKLDEERVYDYVGNPVLMYGCEAWTISKEIENRLKVTEMWFLRRMLRISYVDKIRNEEVLERAGTTRSLVKKTRKRQAVFFGHVMRRKELEHLVTTRKMDGKRSRGRQREKILDSMTV